jgi:membrane-associated protease RseP (regulator of RpoE activity)
MLKFKYNYPLHIFLFLLTFFTTTVSGVQWLNIENYFELSNFRYGIEYSVSLLFILGCHEFGHFFAARYHKVDATLPFFIPMPSIPGFLNFGSLGAVIKTKSRIPDNLAMFDIGAYGPISGFIASLLVLLWGFTHLPNITYLFRIHPEYAMTGIPESGLRFGNTLLFYGLAKTASFFNAGFIPPMNEIYHYPYLCAGWFGLFVTAMNLLPVGQLDGGHIFYTMFGHQRHKIFARIIFILLLVIGLIGLLPLINIDLSFGWSGWLLWALLLFFVVKLEHPPVENFVPLDNRRMTLGWICVIIFFVTFSLTPFSIMF